MKNLILILTLISLNAKAETIQDQIKSLAKANGFTASDQVADAIAEASETYNIDAMQLTAIGIIETGLGKYLKTRQNKNGTQDHGLFQINTVNLPKCKAFRIETIEGSAMCAAKLLSQIKMTKPSDIAKYHSKTCRPDFCPKGLYFSKITKVLKVASDK
jgi:hypothetical protein